MEKYDVISVVGEGSYGLVMRCRHRESGQYVAIKKFLETEDDPTVRKMAMREIRMLKKLRHENLVNMIEVFRRKKRFFLVFEYLEHTVLEELEARAGGLGFVTSRKYCYQVLRALNFIHSHDVIHRDIKPENVLVSRLGVVKLCDFGFARPYAENETFTDYVATRWYRSPELLVGDPRYGKEVDIWAVGCLYAEMMTGEPLFPGESDIDQLFQIVRVLGKLNSRHQNMITRNAMFKGMKQEQSSSLLQLFPDWNRDSLDFLTQCLKMDANFRPDTIKLLKHDLFTRDNFLDTFLVEMRAKLNQEMQGNPLLKRMPSYGSGRKLVEEKKTAPEKPASRRTSDDQKYFGAKEKITQIGLSLLSSQILNGKASGVSDTNQKTINGDEINLNLTTLKQYLGNNTNTNNNQRSNQKTISINNLVFNDDKFARVSSAKPRQTTAEKPLAHFDVHLQPPSPVQFQSLQTENLLDQLQQKITSPSISMNGLTINGNVPQYFNQKRSSNILGLQQVSSKGKQGNQLLPKPNISKRERIINEGGLAPLGQTIGTTPDALSLKDTSPRILAPPPWLSGNLKVMAQGKVTQIGKRGLTDWKSIGSSSTKPLNEPNEFLLPNCPGASTSPYKGHHKKKLSPMSNLPAENHIFETPRNFSPPSDNVNET